MDGDIAMIGGFSLGDVLIGLLVLSFGISAVIKFGRRYSGYPQYFMPALGIYHVVMSFLGMGYIFAFGGDSIAYWRLSADVSQQASTWMEHWGYNTFFIQWLNYVPSRVLGLNYFTGSLIYSLLSFYGFVWLAAAASPYFERLKSSKVYWSSAVFLTLFFLPSFHFWSGFVGKEAVLWFLTMGMLRFYLKKNWFLFLGFSLISIWIRPILGLTVLGFFTSYSLIWGDFSSRVKWVVGLSGGVGFVFGLGLLSYITGIRSFNLDLVRDFSEGQYEFLSRFQASTELTVAKMSLAETLFAVAFRPFPGEISSVWGWAVGLENLVFLLLSMGVLFLFLPKSGNDGFLGILVLLTAWIFMYFMSIALSVSIMGIMIRLKSVLMPFLIWVGYYGWILFLEKIKEGRLKSGA